jgi:chemotaxis protein methyltransferase CheR
LSSTYDPPDPQYLALVELVKRKLGVDLSGYKHRQMHRRLIQFMQQLGENSFAELGLRLENDEKARTKFLDFFTINVTEFFRDEEMFADLQKRILPQILSNHNSRVWTFRVWSAACSVGVEPYTLSIIFQENFPELAYQILGTDIDKTALDRARNAGPYSTNEVRRIPPQLVNKVLTGDPQNGYFLNNLYKTFVRFRQHDLLKDAFTMKYDLILCRNVLIYFTVPAKEELYAKLADSLRPNGVLFTGATEFIPLPERFGLVNLGGPFYQKKA